MKKLFVILIIAVVTSAAYAQHQHAETKQLYTCKMHPEIVRAEPGQCPKCGMTLVPVKEKKKSSAAHAAPETHAEHATHNADGMAMPEHHHAGHEMEMHSSINVADPMNREGSGTSWI